MADEVDRSQSDSIPPIRRSVIDAAEEVLRLAGRPLHARDIAHAIMALGDARLSGTTPWKTVTSRLSMDIRQQQERSRFQREGHALFALREWGSLEFFVRKRRINPIDETIRVVPADLFYSQLYGRDASRLYNLHVERLIATSIAMKRIDAEESEEFIQLIPTFVVVRGSHFLTYRRTKRLPEARLHNSRCVSFGGHMQFDDRPDLFAPSYTDPNGPMFRELYEELAFSYPVKPRYLGVLHLTNSKFERQHAGIVFRVSVAASNEVRSLETTMHTDVQFTHLSDLARDEDSLDSWSRLLLRIVGGSSRHA